jgi:type IV secretion system protein VirB10
MEGNPGREGDNLMKNLKFLTFTALLVLLAASASATVSFAQEKAREAVTIDPEIVVPEGTVLSVYLNSYLNTRSTQVGDHFYADVAYPIWLQQRLIIPKGSTVRGTVTEVVRPGKVKGKGRLAVRVEDILLPNGVKRELNAAFRGIHGPGTEKIDRRSETVEAAGSKGNDAGQVVGTTSQGAIIGAIAGGGSGAGIGAGAGAAVGLATVLFSRGQDLVLEPGTEFELELKQPLKFAYGELDFSNSQLNAVRTNPTRPRNERATRPPYGNGRRIMGIPIPWP